MPAKGSTTRIPRTCEQCGGSFDAWPSKVAVGRARFCSRACADAAKCNHTVLVCELCGKPVAQTPSQLARGWGRYCSTTCYHEAQRAYRSEHFHNGKPVLRMASGYIRVWEPNHPTAHAGYVYEHRLVMERVIGRYLTSEEHVHHVNRKKDDNRPENLVVMSHREHRKLHTRERRRLRNGTLA